MGILYLTEYQCSEAHRTGILGLVLGTEKVALQAKLGKTHMTSFLHGDIIMKTSACIGETGKLFLSPSNPSVDSVGTVVQVVYDLEMSLESSYYDTMSRKLEVPSLGISVDVVKSSEEKQSPVNTEISNNAGTIIILSSDNMFKTNTKDNTACIV